MKVFWQPRVIVIISVIIFSLFANGSILIESIVFPERLTTDISSYEGRFLVLRQALPRRAVVGYISDDSADEETSSARIYIARYALSPLIIVRSLEYPLVVGNFRNTSPDLEIYRKQGLIPLRDFSNGVILFSRESQ
jgi:hypothetical protein